MNRQQRNRLTFGKGALGIAVAAALFAGSGSTSAADPPPEPQLVQDAWMLLIGYEADMAAIRDLLPPGLEPQPSNSIVMNMYTALEDSQTSGLGPYTLTYLAIEVKGHDGYRVGSADGTPGRYVAYYWNSSEHMRAYTRRSGFPDDAGGYTTLLREPGRVTTKLTFNGRPFIEASAQVSGNVQPPVSGHATYLGQKDGKAVKFPLPYSCYGLKTENPSVNFQIPASHPASKLKPKKILWAANVKCTIVYPHTVALR
jgi:acetoacetate decarboxylase